MSVCEAGANGSEELKKYFYPSLQSRDSWMVVKENLDRKRKKRYLLKKILNFNILYIKQVNIPLHNCTFKFIVNVKEIQNKMNKILSFDQGSLV